MGCDIHLVLERKYKNKWIGFEICRSRTVFLPVDGAAANTWEKRFKQGYIWHRASSRDYDLFATLAGVRGDGPEPKGLPEDASELTQAMAGEWDSDGHSHSWCTLEEYIQTLHAVADDPANLFLGSGDPRMDRAYEFYFNMYPPEEGEEYRCVFWFDN